MEGGRDIERGRKERGRGQCSNEGFTMYVFQYMYMYYHVCTYMYILVLYMSTLCTHVNEQHTRQQTRKKKTQHDTTPETTLFSNELPVGIEPTTLLMDMYVVYMYATF